MCCLTNTDRRSVRVSVMLCLAIALVPRSLSAQSWAVGMPVNTVLSHMYLFAGSCTPDPSHRFSFPASPVTGVAYAAIVTVAYPNTITMVPGPVAPLNAGDTIWITDPSVRELFYPSGGGQVSMEFTAIGIPEVIGEAHPCGVNEAWTTDMGDCPETLSLTLQDDCATTSATSIAPTPDIDPWFSIAADGIVLVADDGSIVALQVCDVQGRTIRMMGLDSGSTGQLHLDGLPNGVYGVRAVRNVGTPLFRRFALVR